MDRKTKYEAKDPSIQLVQHHSLVQGKLDRVLDENDQLKLKSDNILSQLTQINTQALQKNSQIKAQSDIILQNSKMLSREILVLKPQLDHLPEQINSIMLHSFLLDKIKKVKINKKISKLHADIIYKIISYENNTKFITCFNDGKIILRNCEDNKIIRTFTDHKESVRDILLLSNGKLASASQDKTIKIWNLTNGNCEQTLIGHSQSIYSLLELPNLILLSFSHDSSIGVWDISQTDNKELQFNHQVKNDKQKQAYCMTSININELAISSYQDINIYSFDNFNNKSFNVIKTLKGHTHWVVDIKLMNNNKDFLLSCSSDKDCRLWSISQENCLRIFKGHSNQIWSMQILSEKIFTSTSAEVIFWNIDSEEAINTIKPDQSEKWILTMIKNDKNELVFAGQHNFIGFIKI